MDPITLFALANGAVSAIKAGCKLYKDVKGAVGDVKDVLKDLDSQFHDTYAAKGKTPPPAAIKQFNEEKAKVRELNKKDPTGVYMDLGKQLGAFFDANAKMHMLFDEEERRTFEAYHGDESIGSRALQRVLMKKQLEQMETELRDLMIYQSPPELGALWTEVTEMSQVLNQRQSVALRKEMREQYEETLSRQRFMQGLALSAVWGMIVLTICVFLGIVFAFVVEDRIEKYPHLGNEWVPKTEEQRRYEQAHPKKYVGR
jgi:hypothetical protein